MTDPTTAPIVQMANITKTFPGGVVANDDVSFAAWEGTIHALIGENGAGKSTLMGILYGRYQPDRGRIRLRGEDVRIQRPAQAIALGIGMVTQHTTLIPALTVIDNIVLGAEPTVAGVLARQDALNRVQEIAARLGIHVDWSARTETLSVAALQKAEIVKALYRGAKILILDEPTATLAPQEVDALFAILNTLTGSGSTVILITHKLREVMAHSTRVTVLRAGRLAAERNTAETSPDELLTFMVGRRGAAPGVLLSTGSTNEEQHAPVYLVEHRTAPPPAAPPIPTLEVRDLSVLSDRRGRAVDSVSFAVAPGEILGMAGVDGSGQHELAEAIVGLRPVLSGSIWLDGTDISHRSIGHRRARGVAYIPEDRHRDGLVLDFTLAENLLLGRERDSRFGGGRILDRDRIAGHANVVIRTYRVLAPDSQAKARGLSGGNQQKIVVARALEGEPRVLVAMQPTRGLDVDATGFVYARLRAAAEHGLGILLFSLDLDEIFEISDRIAVLYNGRLAGIVRREDATEHGIGQLMLGVGL